MKGRNYTWWIVGGIALVLLLWFTGSYNSLVKLDEGTGSAWGNVQSAYQRRADLVPNLVAVVKQYSDYEGELFTEITDARASIGRAKSPAELGAAGQALDSGLSRLLAVVENYPNLKANQNYLDLQVQLEGTENRIKVERDNFNKAVQAYNTKVRRFPSNIVASLFGFSGKDYFAADEGADTAPDVKALFN